MGGDAGLSGGGESLSLSISNYGPAITTTTISAKSVQELVEGRSYVEAGSDIEVIERRGIKEFFQNLGHKIKEGFQKVGEKFREAGQKIKEGFQKAGDKLKEVGHKIKEGFQTAGKKIKEGFQKAGDKLKEVGHKIKEGFQKAGTKIKEGFQKAGKWIKETGAKVAKFGLKVISTVAAVAAHIVRFIPVVGQAASMAMKGVSFGLDKASEAIHANLGKDLEARMHVMDIVKDPIGHLIKEAAKHVAKHIPAVANKFRPQHGPFTPPPPPRHTSPPPHQAIQHIQHPHAPHVIHFQQPHHVPSGPPHHANPSHH